MVTQRGSVADGPVTAIDDAVGFGAYLSDAERAAARPYLMARTLTLARGTHDLGELNGDGVLGLLVLDGFMIRETSLAERRCAALLGPSTLTRPARRDAGPRPFNRNWRALHPVRIALVDQRSIVAAARWPGVAQAVFERWSERVRVETMVATIVALSHLELRLRSVLWLYANLYGHVTADGVVLPVPLTHTDLAVLVAGQRPPVSARLAALAERELVVRRADRTWLLRGGAPEGLTDLRVRTPAVGSEPAG